MKSGKIFAVLFVLALTVINAFSQEQVGFQGYKVLRILPFDIKEWKSIQNLRNNFTDLDFWKQPYPGPNNFPLNQSINSDPECYKRNTVDVMVSPKHLPNVTQFLQSAKINYSIMMDDVDTFLQQQYPPESSEEKRFSFSQYHRLNVIYDYLNELVVSRPDIASLHRESRDQKLKIIKIGKPNDENKPLIIIDAGIHAREWIAPATAVYFIKQLIENYSEHKELVDNIDWYIIPSINPDGYEYTHQNKQNRFWLKNRSPQENGCVGVDLNRNFPYGWDATETDESPCSNTYPGKKNVKEKEVRDLLSLDSSKYINHKVIKAYLTLHSYGQLWLYPADNLFTNLMEPVSIEATEAVKAIHNTTYCYGTFTLDLDHPSSLTWFSAFQYPSYSYQVELRDTNKYGFLLPPDQILPTAEEAWEGVKVVARQLILEKKP